MVAIKTDLGTLRESARRIRVETTSGLVDTDIQDALQSVEGQFNTVNATITNLSNSISSISVSAGLTSVGFSFANTFTVTGSPMTANGTLTIGWHASNTIPNANIPNPTATQLGGILSAAPATNNWIYQITATGSVLSSRPSASNLNDGTTGSGAIVLTTNPTISAPTVIGNLSASTINGITLSNTAGTTASLVITSAKTLKAVNSITLAGADGTTVTFPGTTDTIPGIGQNNTFTGNNTFSGSVTFSSSVIFGSQITVKATPVTATVYTATSTDYYLEVSATAPTTIWLIASPSTGRTLMVVDVAANAATQNITVTGNGHNIVAGTSSSTYVISTNGGTAALTFGNFNVWKVN